MSNRSQVFVWGGGGDDENKIVFVESCIVLLKRIQVAHCLTISEEAGNQKPNDVYNNNNHTYVKV